MSNRLAVPRPARRSSSDFRTESTAGVRAHVEDDPLIGKNLQGRFTILSRLGSGSMGTVYRARQHAMGRSVAIKVLRNDRAWDEQARARFLSEARAHSLLVSPHTVTVFDFGQAEGGEFYLAMELLEGESLGQRLHRVSRLPFDVAVDVTRQALRSLAEAHAKGIIHRDLKPDNLFFARLLEGGKHEEIVKVLDFGIAKMRRGDGFASPVETQAGTVFGTPRFMSPEQAQGKPLDGRSDVYSLGVILYQMLTGRPPFTDDDAVVVMARHIKTKPVPPSEACPEAAIPAALEHVLMRVLSKDPHDRPESAEAFSRELALAVQVSADRLSGNFSVPPSSSPTLAIPRRRRFPHAMGAALAATAVLTLSGAALLLWPKARASASPTFHLAPASLRQLERTPPLHVIEELDAVPMTLVPKPRAARPKSAPMTEPPQPAPAPTPTSSYGLFE